MAGERRLGDDLGWYGGGRAGRLVGVLVGTTVLVGVGVAVLVGFGVAVLVGFAVLVAVATAAAETENVPAAPFQFLTEPQPGANTPIIVVYVPAVGAVAGTCHFEVNV